MEWSSSVQQQAVAALEAGACNEFWELIWPHAKTGQPEAALLLSTAMYSRGLSPPGAGRDILFRLRGIMAGYAESARNGNPHAVELLGALLQADVFEEGGGQQHSACLLRNPDKSACIDAALRSQLFPAFGQWVDEVEAIGKSGGVPVCTRSVREQKLDDEDFDVRPTKPNESVAPGRPHTRVNAGSALKQ